jgi:hypothetical protein
MVASIKKAFAAGRLHHLPLIEEAVNSGLGDGTAFYALLPQIYERYVLGFFASEPRGLGAE